MNPVSFRNTFISGNQHTHISAWSVPVMPRRLRTKSSSIGKAQKYKQKPLTLLHCRSDASPWLRVSLSKCR